MQKAKRQVATAAPSVPTSSIDCLVRTPADKVALRAAIAEAEESDARGEYVTAEESRSRTRAVLERYRSRQ